MKNEIPNQSNFLKLDKISRPEAKTGISYTEKAIARLGDRATD